MVERRQIVEWWRRGDASTLVSLVRTAGSSYRRVGARLLVASGGASAGTLSGGCLEGEIVKKAPWMVRNGPVVERYSTLFDDTAEVPFGLGCGGIVDLLFERVDTAEGTALLRTMERSLEGMRAMVVTWLPDAATAKKLRRLILGPSGELIFASEGLAPEHIDCARGLVPGKEYDGRFVEELKPPQRLIVLGAGDDAKPLVNMAALLGWSVTAADGRPQRARAERFPAAERVVALGASIDELAIHSEDAVVLMTHSYEQDRDLLAAVLPLTPRYLGVLGARHRSSLLVNEAAAMIGLTVAECCSRIYAPVGLDLGGDGPEAIALAILAEAQACMQGKLGTSRRLSAEDVEAQVQLGGAGRYLQVQCELA